MSISVNGDRINPIQFPGGERHVNLKDISISTINFNVEAKIKSSDDLMDMVLVCDGLYRMAPEIPINLLIPYLPYARQDRVCAEGDAFSLNVLARIINTLYVKQVISLDVHNPTICSQYINSFRNISNYRFLRNICNNLDFDFLICPDEGAAKKYDVWKYTPSTVFCEKIRDPSTGKLSGFKISDDNVYVPKDNEVGLIVDDICDGGGTFFGIAELFSNRLSLAVTHGIFSKGLEDLLNRFDNIYTTNSWCELESDDRLKVFDWKDHIDG